MGSEHIIKEYPNGVKRIDEKYNNNGGLPGLDYYLEKKYVKGNVELLIGTETGYYYENPKERDVYNSEFMNKIILKYCQSCSKNRKTEVDAGSLGGGYLFSCSARKTGKCGVFNSLNELLSSNCIFKDVAKEEIECIEIARDEDITKRRIERRKEKRKENLGSFLMITVFSVIVYLIFK